jgi:hypothetical protein
VGFKVDPEKLERIVFEIENSRLPLRVLAAKLLAYEQLVQAVRAHTGWRPLLVQQALEAIPRLNDKEAWARLSAEQRDEAAAEGVADLFKEEDLMRKDFE